MTFDGTDMVALYRLIETAEAGRRESHDALIDWYHRARKESGEIPKELEDYYSRFPNGVRKKLRKSPVLPDWQQRALTMVMFAKVNGDTQEDIAEKLGVDVNILKTFLKRHRKRSLDDI